MRGLRRSMHAAAVFAVALAMHGCGQGNSGDSVVSGLIPTTGPDSFLLFPNPLVRQDGTSEINSAAYASAYYTAIDPNNAKDTLEKWKAANGFGGGTGTQSSVVFGDVRDLGYGRRMTGRQNGDGTIAFLVENYLVNVGPEYGNSALNLEAAVLQDRRWIASVNGIEFSPGPGGGTSFAKYFSFNPVTGTRDLFIDLDGRGAKAMPGVCISCHGGRGDPLTPPGATGHPLFPMAQNSVSQKRGDIEGRFVPFEVDGFNFSTLAGYTRSAQEAALKQMNKLVLCTYPLPTPSALPEDACRRPAVAGDYQGPAAAFLKAVYGGDSMPNAAYADAYIPAGWLGATQTRLYQNVVVPACRSCHLVRGNGFQSDLDFDTFAKFQGFADRTKALATDRGNMPLAKIIYENFWNSTQATGLADFLQGQGHSVRDAAGAILRPGRPVAIPGPDRTITQGATTLSAEGSLYATAYTWSIVSGPNGTVPPVNATLSNATTPRPVFNASADGAYVLQLVASKGAAQSDTARVNLLVNAALTPAPSTIRFSNIKTAVQSSGCTGCHAAGGPPLTFVSTIDRNGDGKTDATDDDWFYAEVRGRINFTDLVASPLLRKPSGNHHGGGQRPGFDTTAQPGLAARATYDLFLNWILNGAPQ